jgi:hypothetical protein
VMIGKMFDSAKMPAGLLKFYMSGAEPEDKKTTGTNVSNNEQDEL